MDVTPVSANVFSYLQSKRRAPKAGVKSSNLVGCAIFPYLNQTVALILLAQIGTVSGMALNLAR